MKIDRIKLAALHAEVKTRHKYQDIVDELKAEHLKEIREIKKAAIKNADDAKTKKRSRTNDRTEVYRAAIKNAATPDDAHSVLRSMQGIARERRFPHLLGYVPGEGFQWVATLAEEPPNMQSDKSALEAIRREMKKALR